ncbi:MAG: TIM-barrel domain-containing protein [Planctomycetota bacterium]
MALQHTKLRLDARILELRERLARWRRPDTGDTIGARVTRYRDPRHADTPLAPFPAYAVPPTPIETVGSPSATPIAFTSVGRRNLARVAIQPGTSLYATGEVAGPLLRNGRHTTCWNTDAFGYDDTTPALYQSHPFVLGVRADGAAFGVICESTYRTEIDLRAGLLFRVHGPAPAVTLIERDSPEEVLQALAELTGFIQLPPMWALGYHQCRYSYEPDDRVREIAREFRQRDLPCDVIWMDIDYMDGYRCFTFDKSKFPDPARLNHDLHDKGFKAIWMIDPGLKVDPDYHAYTQGHQSGHFVTDAGGIEFHGPVWPGPCAFPDFTNADARTWWASLYQDFMATGIDGVWNDMNEPAVFVEQQEEAVVPESRTMPLTNRHRADDELGGPGDHARYHNLYGMQMVRATLEGVRAANPDKRPFVLTRAGFLGSHRYAATWTGDNVSSWPHLHWSLTMVLNLGLSGQPFSGPDIGGFAEDCTPELFARWMGLGGLLPFARGHSIKESHDHEPWSFGPDVEHVCRLALQRRYRLIPYLYTLFREAAATGLPVARPLFFHDPTNTELRDVDDVFLLGADVLVRARVHEDPDWIAPLPPGFWPSFELADRDDTDDPDHDHHPQLPVLHLRAGAIVPVGPVMQHTQQRALDPLTLLVALDEMGEARGTLYEDAGEGFGYRDGDFLLTHYRAVREQGRVRVSVTHREGDRPRPDRPVRVRLFRPDGNALLAEGRDGEDIVLELEAPAAV